MKGNIDEYKEEFVSLLKSTGREGVDDVIEKSTSWDFSRLRHLPDTTSTQKVASLSTRSTPARPRSPYGRR